MRKKFLSIIILFVMIMPICVNAISAGIYSSGAPAPNGYAIMNGSGGNFNKYRLTHIPMVKFTLVDLGESKDKLKPLSSYHYSVWFSMTSSGASIASGSDYHGASGMIFNDAKAYGYGTAWQQSCYKNCNTFGAKHIIGAISADGKSYTATDYVLGNYKEPRYSFWGPSTLTFNGESDLRRYFIDDGATNDYSRLKSLLLNDLNIKAAIGEPNLNFDKLSASQVKKINNLAIVYEPIGSFCMYNTSRSSTYGFAAGPCIFATFKGFNKLLVDNAYYRGRSQLMVYPKNRYLFTNLIYFNNEFSLVNKGNNLKDIDSYSLDSTEYYRDYSDLKNGYGFGILYFSDLIGGEPEPEPEPEPEKKCEETKEKESEVSDTKCVSGSCKIVNSCTGNFSVATTKTVKMKISAIDLKNDNKYKEEIAACKAAGYSQCSVHFCDDIVNYKIKINENVSLSSDYSYNSFKIYAGGGFPFGYKFLNYSSWEVTDYNGSIVYEIVYRRKDSSGNLIDDVFKKGISYDLDYSQVSSKVVEKISGYYNNSAINNSSLNINNLTSNGKNTSLSSAILKKCSNGNLKISNDKKSGSKEFSCTYSIKSANIDSNGVVSYGTTQGNGGNKYYIYRSVTDEIFKWKISSSGSILFSNNSSAYSIDSGKNGNKCYVNVYNEFNSPSCSGNSCDSGTNKSRYVFRVVDVSNPFPNLKVDQYPYEWNLYATKMDRDLSRIKDSYIETKKHYAKDFSVNEVSEINKISTSYKSYENVNSNGTDSLVKKYFSIYKADNLHCKLGEFKWGCDQS